MRSRRVCRGRAARTGRPLGLAAIVLLLLASAGQAQTAPPWPDTFVTRLEALALVQSLNAQILAGRSATLSLETWCRDHRLAEPPVIVAEQVKGVDRPPTTEQRRRLRVTDDDVVRYRRVRLRCGSRVLSEAENWYVPGRLTAEMNALLDASTTPFGKVVQPLQPYRQTLEVTRLWQPLPDGWEQPSAARFRPAGRTLTIPDALFAHRALLFTGSHEPFSEVVEVYQRQVLAFPPPAAR